MVHLYAHNRWKVPPISPRPIVKCPPSPRPGPRHQPHNEELHGSCQGVLLSVHQVRSNSAEQNSPALAGLERERGRDDLWRGKCRGSCDRKRKSQATKGQATLTSMHVAIAHLQPGRVPCPRFPRASASCSAHECRQLALVAHEHPCKGPCLEPQQRHRRGSVVTPGAHRPLG